MVKQAATLVSKPRFKRISMRNLTSGDPANVGLPSPFKKYLTSDPDYRHRNSQSQITDVCVYQVTEENVSGSETSYRLI